MLALGYSEYGKLLLPSPALQLFNHDLKSLMAEIGVIL